jgi:hypothetical protein
MSKANNLSTGRKRGGQPGNKNAMRHGLYAKRISRAEDDVISKMKVTHIQGEISYMRVVCARIAKILENNGLDSEATKSLSDQTLMTLSSLDRTLTTLLSYVRQYALLTGEMNELDADIEEGKDKARKELSVYQYLDPSADEG